MKHSLILNWQSARRALTGFFRQPFGNLLTLLLLAVALSLPLGLYQTVKGLSAWAGQLTSVPQMTLFMELSADTADVKAVEAALKQHPGVASIEFVGRDKALKGLLARNGLDGMQDGLGGNPLPDAFIVTPKDMPATQLEHLQRELSGLPLVELAQFDASWAHKLDAILTLGWQLLLGLGIVLAVALVLVTHNTIRLQVLARRDEIEVAKLIGATNGFIRRPFMYHALWQGIFAALIAWGLSAGFAGMASPALGQIATLYGSQARLAPLDADEIAILIAASALLTMLGARLAVNHHLRQLAPH